MFYEKRPKPCNFIKKETLAQVFSSEFHKISKNTFFTEHLLATASETSEDLRGCIFLMKSGEQIGYVKSPKMI